LPLNREFSIKRVAPGGAQDCQSDNAWKSSSQLTIIRASARCMGTLIETFV
jgi:hypothetical protein